MTVEMVSTRHHQVGRVAPCGAELATLRKRPRVAGATSRPTIKGAGILAMITLVVVMAPGFANAATVKAATICSSPGLTKGCKSYVLPALSPSAGTLGAVGRVWAEAELTALAAPETSANIKTLEDWFLNEGNNPVHGKNNPLNSNVRYGGSTSFGPNDQNYKTPTYGIYGMANQFTTVAGGSQSYTAILANLRSGIGLLGTQSWKVKAELKVYSGGGYNSIPAAYCGGSPTCGE
jgi:hypothetical protein